MIMQPQYVTEETVSRALADVAKKENRVALFKMRFQPLEEGTVAQIMHLDRFSEEGPTIARLHDFICEKGFSFNGPVQKHHEIYLNDVRRVAPEKMKTVIRQPFVKK
jgi:hypothetical protein